MNISSDGKTITMRAPDNWHAHFRQGVLIAFLVSFFIRFGWRRRILAMPNTTPPKLTGPEALDYAEQIKSIGRQMPNGGSFEPIAVIQITEQTTPEMIREAIRLGVRVGKVYPYFVTTNSENGVKDYKKIYPALAVAEELGMVVCFHGEDPDFEVEGLDKEAAFLVILDEIVCNFSRLKIVLEHITTAAAVK